MYINYYTFQLDRNNVSLPFNLTVNPWQNRWTDDLKHNNAQNGKNEHTVLAMECLIKKVGFISLFKKSNSK